MSYKLVFSIRTKDCTATELVPERRKRRDGELKIIGKKYNYFPSQEYLKHVLKFKKPLFATH